MSNSSQKVCQRRRLLVAAPVAAIAALVLASCSANEEPSGGPMGAGEGAANVIQANPDATAPTEGQSTADKGLTDNQSVLADIKDTSGANVGRAGFEGSGDSVTVSLSVTGMPPGLYGLAVTSAGVCEASDDFESAGEVLNDSANATAGLPKDGDLPTLLVNSDGTGVQTMTSGALDIETLTNEPGTALVIGADGDTSSRVACGVIERQ